MRTEEQTYQLFEDYISDRLSIEAKNQLDNELNSDPNLKLEFEAHLQAHQLVTIGALYELEEKVKNFKPQQSSGSGLSSWIMGLAFVAGITSWLIIHDFDPVKNSNSTSSSQNVFVEDFDNTQQNRLEVLKEDEIELGKTNQSEESQTSNNVRTSPESDLGLDESNNSVDTSGTIEALDSRVGLNSEKKGDDSSQEKKQEEKLSNCIDIVLTANVNATKTCTGLSEGSIILTGIKGGESPYLIALNDQEPKKYAVFDNLSVGEYSVTLSDANSCSTTIESIKVEQKACNSGIGHAFSPSNGQFFTVPNTDNRSGLFEVYDITNSLKASIRFYSELKWDGQNEYGGLLNSGEYSYKIKYENGEITTGTISIIQ